MDGTQWKHLQDLSEIKKPLNSQKNDRKWSTGFISSPKNLSFVVGQTDRRSFKKLKYLKLVSLCSEVKGFCCVQMFRVDTCTC